MCDKGLGQSTTPNEELTPLEYFLGLLRDPQTPEKLRFEAAKIIFPYFHDKKSRECVTDIALHSVEDSVLQTMTDKKKTKA